MWDIRDCLTVVISTSENIIRRRVIFKKTTNWGDLSPGQLDCKSENEPTPYCHHHHQWEQKLTLPFFQVKEKKPRRRILNGTDGLDQVGLGEKLSQDLLSEFKGIMLWKKRGERGSFFSQKNAAATTTTTTTSTTLPNIFLVGWFFPDLFRYFRSFSSGLIYWRNLRNPTFHSSLLPERQWINNLLAVQTAWVRFSPSKL